MVHQHFMLFPSLTVTENVIYGSEPGRGGLIDRQEAEASVRELSGRFGLQIDPQARVGALPVGVRQRIEILKMLYRGAEILILDEPTNSFDNTTESIVKKRLHEYTRDRTLLLVTHKAPMLDLVERLIVMDEGRIVMDGPKEEVLNALKGTQNA